MRYPGVIGPIGNDMEHNKLLRSVRLALFPVIVLTVMAVLFPVSSAQARYAAIVLDADTGRVLHASNPDTRNYPASLTKMMTLYLVFEALESGHLKLDSQLPVSRRAQGMSPSKLGLKTGEKISVEAVILSLVTKSANDAAVVVAEALGGTEIKFALLMTKKAKALGMRRTTFRNASGLPNRRQLSTARDMAKLAGQLIKDFPQYYSYFSRAQYSFRGKDFKNHNSLLKSFPGTDGIKTGYIRASGFNLAASAERDNRRLIGVVFGGKTARSRDKHMKSLLERGFAQLARDSKKISASQPFATLSQKKIEKPSPRPAKVAPNRLPNRIALIPPPTPTPVPGKNVTTGNPFATTATRSKPAVPVAPAWAGNPDEWAIQVGAYGDIAPARKAAKKAVSRIPKLTENTRISIAPYHAGDRLMYRARLIGMSQASAETACKRLERRKIPCISIAPNRSGQSDPTDNNQTANRPK